MADLIERGAFAAGIAMRGWPKLDDASTFDACVNRAFGLGLIAAIDPNDEWLVGLVERLIRTTGAHPRSIVAALKENIAARVQAGSLKAPSDGDSNG